MQKKSLLHIIEWAVALAALGYLGYRLATYEDYALVGESLSSMNVWQWLALVVCVALMPVNMLLEAWRWRSLMDEQISWRETQRQVYYSKLAGLITPWRLGEYPARALLAMENQESRDKSQETMKKVLSAGAVGSATMTLAIVIAGVVCLVFSPTVLTLLKDSYLYALLAVILVLSVGLYFAPKWLQKYAEMNRELMLKSVGQSLVRLACWCVQLALILYALNALGISGLINGTELWFMLPVYYLLITITPNIPIVEAGVRGAWAIFLFGTANAALAGVLLWAINTLLPCLVWLCIKAQKKEAVRNRHGTQKKRP